MQVGPVWNWLPIKWNAYKQIRIFAQLGHNSFLNENSESIKSFLMEMKVRQYNKMQLY